MNVKRHQGQPTYHMVQYKFLPAPVRFSHPGLLIGLCAVVLIQAALLAHCQPKLWWLWTVVGVLGASLPGVMAILEERGRENGD